MRAFTVAGVGMTAVLGVYLLDRLPRPAANRPPRDALAVSLSAAQSTQILRQAEAATRPYEQMLGTIAGVDFCGLRSKEWVKTTQATLQAAEQRAEASFHLQAGQQDDEQEFNSHIYNTSLGSIMFNRKAVYDPQCRTLATSPAMLQLDAFAHQLPAG